MSESDGQYLSYTEHALPVKVRSPPDGPVSVFVGTKFAGKMVHTEAVPNGRPSGYWVAADDEGNLSNEFLDTRFDVAIANLLLANGYIDHVTAYLLFDRRHDASPSPTAAYVLPDRDPEIEPSGVKPGLLGFGLGVAIAVMIFVIGRIFL